MKLFRALPILVLFTFSHCTVELEVPPPSEPERLNVLALLDCRDTVSRVLVERTFGFHEPFPTTDPIFQGRATVRFSRNGQDWATFQPEPGSNFYRAGHEPIGLEEGLTLTVFHPSFGTVEAVQEPPAEGTLLSARLLNNVPLPSGATLTRALEVRLQDTPGRANYYELYGSDGDSTTQEDFLLIGLELAQAGNDETEITTITFDGSRLLTDEGWDGAELRLLFALGTEADDYPAPALAVRYATESYYRYVEYLASFRTTVLAPATSEEEPYSNFSDGGLGVFGLYVEEWRAVER